MPNIFGSNYLVLKSAIELNLKNYYEKIEGNISNVTK